MTLQNTTHVNFRGDARAALEFYASVFGGELTVFTNQDMHSAETPEEAGQVKWGGVTSPDGFSIMAYDVPASQQWSRGTDSFFESVRAASVDEAQSVWDKLAEGATVRAAFGPAPWAPAYGMLTDRFGVTWVVDVQAQY